MVRAFGHGSDMDKSRFAREVRFPVVRYLVITILLTIYGGQV